MTAIDVAYRLEGQGPPLYMIHGIGSRAVMWDSIIGALKDQFTCVSFDLRGHGASPVQPKSRAISIVFVLWTSLVVHTNLTPASQVSSIQEK